MKNRTEHDFLGDFQVPGSVYWGIHTARAAANFTMSSLQIDPGLIQSLALVKKSCASANRDLGFLEAKKAEAVIEACEEIEAGRLHDQFPLDALQGGAGTSTNMNINEVLANRAIELCGGQKGEYDLVDPLREVNLHQSTNDVYPTAVKIAAIRKLRTLSSSVASLQGAFQRKEKEWAAVVKIGRTELQEAVPMTLGAEFSAFAEALSRDRWRIFKCEERLRVVNIGGTAVGTGLCAPRSYIFLVIEKLREYSGLPLSRGENLAGETANGDPFVEVSGILKAHGASLLKIANDIRLLALLGEVALSPMQAGSSIMAGKVNPVMMEAVMQAAMKVMANDMLIMEAVSRSTFQIVEFMPLVAHALLESLNLLDRTAQLFAHHVDTMTARGDRCREYMDRSPMLVTAFLPHTGYEEAAELVRQFRESGGGDLRRFLTEKLGSELVERILLPYNLTALGYREHEKDA